MATPDTNEKDQRINVRVSEWHRDLIKRAADVTGTTMSDFILVPAVERAALVLAAEQVTRLDADVAERFLAWLDSPTTAVDGMERLADAAPFDH